MLIQAGTIAAIEEKKIPGHEKKVVTLHTPEKKEAYVEFRGKLMMSLLDDYNYGDTVQIAIVIDGKKSKSSGVSYNNLVAKSIKKANH